MIEELYGICDWNGGRPASAGFESIWAVLALAITAGSMGMLWTGGAGMSFCDDCSCTGTGACEADVDEEPFGICVWIGVWSIRPESVCAAFIFCVMTGKGEAETGVADASEPEYLVFAAT